MYTVVRVLPPGMTRVACSNSRADTESGCAYLVVTSRSKRMDMAGTVRLEARWSDGPEAAHASRSNVDDAMWQGAVEADAVPRPEPMDLVGDLNVRGAFQHESALLRGIGERLLAAGGALLVDADEELDLPGQVRREELIRDALSR